MARLPGALELGETPSIGPRPVANVDVSGFARGGAALAAGAEKLGQGISQVGREVSEVQQKWNESRAFDAHAGAAAELLSLHSELQKSKDYGTLDSQYQDQSKQIVDRWAQTIPSGRLREHFLASQGEAVARGAASVSQMAFHGMAQSDADRRKAALMDIESKIGEDPTNAFLPDAMRGLGLSVDSAVAAGYETKERGDLEKRAAAVQIAIRTNEVEYNRDPVGWLQAHGYEPRQSRALAKLQDLSERSTFRGGALPPDAVKGFIFHHTSGSGTAEGVVDTLNQRGLGVQYVMDRDGSIYRTLPNGARGAHMLPSKINDLSNANTEGMEIIAKNNSDVTPAQVASAKRFAEDYQKSHPGVAFFGHGEVNPGHKEADEGMAVVNAVRDGGGVGGGGGDTSGFNRIDPLTQMRMVTQARSLAQRRASDEVAVNNLAINDRTQQYERLLIDASAGRGAMPPREMIESDLVLSGNEAHRNTLLRQWDNANKQDEAFQSWWERFKNPDAGPFNQVDTDDKKQADKAYHILVNGDPERELPVLQSIVDRTGIVPESAATAMAGALVSNSPQRIGAAAQMALNLTARNPQIFAGVKDGKELAAAAVAYEHYSQYFGPERAGQIIAEHNSPEYKAKVAARIKGEDVNEIIKKQLTPGDLEKGFGEGWGGVETGFWAGKEPLRHPFTTGRPNVEFTEEGKDAAFADYAELFKDNYQNYGDIALAKTQAIEQMKKIWGVSHITGKATGALMRFPPEQAPAYAGIPDLSTRIADQAIEAIKAESAPSGPQLESGAPVGLPVSRDQIILTPVPRGQTAQAYMAGQPVPYLLSWRDKDGTTHMLNPGRAFVFDGHAEREKISEERRLGLEKGAARAREGNTYIVGTPSPAERLRSGQPLELGAVQ
jgi:hypothetical protein